MKWFYLCVLLWVGCVYTHAVTQKPKAWFATTPVADLEIHQVFRTRVLFSTQGETAAVRLGDRVGQEKLTLKHAHPRRIVLEGFTEIVVLLFDEQNGWQTRRYQTPTAQPGPDKP